MPGGSYPRGRWPGLPLQEQPSPRSSGRHCWVRDPPGHPGRWPGLLVEWRRDPSGLWEGRVVYALDQQLVEAWLSQQALEPR